MRATAAASPPARPSKPASDRIDDAQELINLLAVALARDDERGHRCPTCGHKRFDEDRS